MALARAKAAIDGESGKGGILPAHAIQRLIDEGGIALGQPVIDGQIQPASLDLRLGHEAYRVRASFLPGPGICVADKLEAHALHAFDLAEGAVLETGSVYVVPLLEGLALPEHLAAVCNPKSSTGRLDVFTRVITDGARAFDQVEAGYEGPLYAEICAQTFPVVVRTGSRLSQIRFRAGDAVLSDAALTELHRNQPLVHGGEVDIAEGIALSVDLKGNEKTGLIGYRAKRHTGLIDVDVPGALEILDYWEPIYSRCESHLILDPDQFYILSSKEAVTIPPSHAAEMVPFNPLVGEFRVHYAGFFDPGFGYAQAGGAGARAVLEVRSHKVPFILEDGQIIGRLVYEPLTEPPEQVYGTGIGSHYQAQGLKLSKHFKSE